MDSASLSFADTLCPSSKIRILFFYLQVLHGDLEEAICHHAYYYAIWKRFGCLPERYNWNLNAAEVKFYPLRPEFIESTYFLYQVSIE